jgi:hypothetical protein
MGRASIRIVRRTLFTALAFGLCLITASAAHAGGPVLKPVRGYYIPTRKQLPKSARNNKRIRLTRLPVLRAERSYVKSVLKNMRRGRRALVQRTAKARTYVHPHTKTDKNGLLRGLYWNENGRNVMREDVVMFSGQPLLVIEVHENDKLHTEVLGTLQRRSGLQYRKADGAKEISRYKPVKSESRLRRDIAKAVESRGFQGEIRFED